MQGIYKIVNRINNKIYVGMSSDIEKRWKQHKTKHLLTTDKEYEKLLYRAFRKYGIENFDFEIIEEENDLIQRKEKEKYYIQLFDSYKNGYNETIGGDICEMQIGETHSNAKLTEKDVIDIRTRYNNHERCKEVYLLFEDKIEFNGFHKIWKGETWTHIMMEVYTTENIEFHRHNTGQKGSQNGKAILTEEDVYNIRMRKKNGEPRKKVYEDYNHILTLAGFDSIWYGYNWKHVIV